MTVFIIAVALANAGLYHRPLYSFAAANLDYSSLNGVLTLATLFILVVFVTASIFSLLSVASRRLIKPVCMVAALGNAVALYFVQSYGVVLDKSMMGNVFNTDVTEASSLFHPKLLNVERLSASRQQMLLPAATFLANEKTIVVLVIGEAARA